MTECAAAGVPPSQFWDLTHREIHAILGGAGLVARRQQKLAIMTAWHTVNLGRPKNLPKLSDLLRKLDPVRIMSNSAIRSAVIGMAAAMGATVVRRPKKKD